MLKIMEKIGKVIMEACSAGLIVGGAVLIYEKIFIAGYQIGGILDNCKQARREAKEAVKANG